MPISEDLQPNERPPSSGFARGRTGFNSPRIPSISSHRASRDPGREGHLDRGRRGWKISGRPKVPSQHSRNTPSGTSAPPNLGILVPNSSSYGLANPRQMMRNYPSQNNRQYGTSQSVRSVSTDISIAPLSPAMELPPDRGYVSACFDLTSILPRQCWKGTPDFQLKREEWLRSVVPKLEEEREIKIHTHEFLDSVVRFSCAKHKVILDPEVISLRESSSKSSARSRPSSIRRSVSEELTLATYPASQSFEASPSTGTALRSPPRSSHCVLAKVATHKDMVDAHQSSTGASRPPVKVRTFGSDSGPSQPKGVEPRVSRKPWKRRRIMDLNSVSEPEAVIIDLTDGHIDSPIDGNSQDRNAFPFAFRSGKLTIKSQSSNAPCSSPSPALPPLSGFSCASDNSSITRMETLDHRDAQTSLERSNPSREVYLSTASKQLRPNIYGASMTNSINLASQGKNNSVNVPALGAPRGSGARLRLDEDIIQLPRINYDKPRRILLAKDKRSLLDVSMHGFIDKVDVGRSRETCIIRTPAKPTEELIDDACIFTSADQSFVLLGHARQENHISLITLGATEIGQHIQLKVPPQRGKPPGISAVCPMQYPLQFASGGYDHEVYLWEMKKDLSTATPKALGIKHTALVQSLLAFRDTSHKLASASADCKVNIYDLPSERTVSTLRLSNSVYHIHEALSPFCTLLEVAHREMQFEIRDHRIVPEQPVQRFGYHALKLHGRFVKGDMNGALFACGDLEGSVRLWDMRNLKGYVATPEPCFPGQRVVQVVFNETRLVACSEDNRLASLYVG